MVLSEAIFDSKWAKNAVIRDNAEGGLGDLTPTPNVCKPLQPPAPTKKNNKFIWGKKHTHNRSLQLKFNFKTSRPMLLTGPSSAVHPNQTSPPEQFFLKHKCCCFLSKWEVNCHQPSSNPSYSPEITIFCCFVCAKRCLESEGMLPQAG